MEQTNDKLFEDLKQIDWIKWLIIALGVWLFFYPHPYTILVTTIVAIPLITLIIHGIRGRRPSLATLFDGIMDNKSRFSPLTHALCSTLAIGFRIFLDYDPENMFEMMGVGVLAILPLTLLLFITHKPVDKNDEPATYYVLLALLLLFYTPTSTFAINCLHDNTEPHVYNVKVVSKSKSSSKSDADLYIDVASWTNHPDPVSIQVSPDKYYDVEEGDLVNVHVRDGLFGIGWWYVVVD